MNLLATFAITYLIATSIMAVPNESARDCRRLHAAVISDDSPLVAQLLRYVGADCRDKLGQTALHSWAKTGGSLEVFALLAYRGSANLDARAQDGTTPFLLAAVHQNKIAMVTLYYASRARNLININAQNSNGFTALHVAVLSQNASIIDLLLSMQADWSIVDNDGRSPDDLARLLGL